MSLLTELERRNVFRVALAYAISAWLLIQVLEIATDAFEAPAWVLKIFITLLIIGAVPVLIFSWVYEMTPEGLRRESDRDPGQDGGTTGKLNVAVIALLVLAIGLFVGQQFIGGTSGSDPTAEAEPVQAEPIAPLGEKSIAVLPFENFSGSEDDTWFSDGLADTLLHRLAQVDDLTVIARNSSFVYKGQNVDIRQVGQDLGVANVLEGSVQRQGDRLRVIAQLIESASGTHIWSETYDRSLSDIFSIQDEIATSVTQALQVKLLGGEAERLTRAGTEDATAWALYLAAKDIVDAVDFERLEEARGLLMQAIDRDPEFVEAYHSLARIYNVTAWQAPNPAAREAALENGFEAINRAIALDPDNPVNLQQLGNMRRRNYQTLEAIALLEAYLATNRNDADSHMALGLAQHNAGLFKSAYQSFREGIRLDPKAAIFLRQLGFTSIDLGNIDEGLEWYARGLKESDWGVFITDLAGVHIRVVGRWEPALEVLSRHPLDDRWGISRLQEVLVGVGLLDHATRLIEFADDRMEDPAFTTRLRLVLANFDDRHEFDEESVARAADGGLFSRAAEFTAWRCLSRGDYECTLATLRPLGEAFESSFSRTPFIADTGDIDVAAWLALAELQTGDEDRGERLLAAVLKRANADVESGEAGCRATLCNSLAIAEIKAALGDTVGAYEALEASLPADSDLFLRWGLLRDTPIEKSPYLDSIRDQPRFDAFVQELMQRQARVRERMRSVADDLIAGLNDRPERPVDAKDFRRSEDSTEAARK